MLSQITIQNFGLIERISIDFAEHLNILTGETGAGKSIIIDALRYVLGERFETSLVRDPKIPCLVQAAFEINDKHLRNHSLFADYLNDGESQLIIERSFQPDGKNKIKINGLALTVGQLKEIGNHLIDFHGAHDHQMLLQEDQHILMLDKLIAWGNIKKDYQESFGTYSALVRELHELSNLAQTNMRDLELLRHQISELEQVPLSEEEFQKTEQDQLKINNAQRLSSCVEQILNLFEDEETGIDTLLRKSFSALKTLSQVDPSTSRLADDLTSAQESAQDFLDNLRSYADSLSFNAQEAETINARYDIYQDVKRKYGPSLTDAAEFYTQSKTKFDQINNFSENDADLRKKIDVNKSDLKKLADKITKKRQQAASQLKSTIENELKELGISHVIFEARLEPTDFTSDGLEKIIFYISPNAGESLKPLAQIVSSGEAARVMLALKKALIDVDTIPTLIFDEIDAQIGGRLGTITGKKLKELAHKRQVLLITHLPQIASFADIHIKIYKSVVKGRAVTQITQLDEDGRIQEISEMLNGQDKSDISTSHAQDMIAAARKTKASSKV